MDIYGFSSPEFFSRPCDLKIRPLITSMTVSPEATSACIILIPKMRLMTIGIKAEMAAIGSHFFKKVRFKLNRCYIVLFIIFLTD
jgi:hypothetical protein